MYFYHIHPSKSSQIHLPFPPIQICVLFKKKIHEVQFVLSISSWKCGLSLENGGLIRDHTFNEN